MFKFKTKKVNKMQTITGKIYTQHLSNEGSDAELLAIANKMVELIERDYQQAKIEIEIIENVQGAVDSSIELYDNENCNSFDQVITEDISEYYYLLACELL